MAKKTNLEPSALLSQLLTKKAEDAITVKGYIGPAAGTDHVLFYTNIFDLSKCFEIKTSDIIHSVEAPESLLPFDGVVLWLKKDAEVLSRNVVAVGHSGGDTFIQRHAGRIIINLAKDKGGDAKCLCVPDGSGGTTKCTSGCSGNTTKCTSGCSGNTTKCTSGCSTGK